MSHWEISPLDSVATIQSGIGFPTHLQGKSAGKYPFAKVADISKLARSGSDLLHHTENYIDERERTELRGRPIPPGSVIFAKIGEAIRQNFRILTAVPCFVDNNVMAITPDPSRLDSRFLYHLSRTWNLMALASTTTVPSIRKSTLSVLDLPSPPLEEQRRLAAVLDGADALRAKRREAIARLDELARSLFLDMFGDLTAFPRRALDELAEISSGITKGRKTSASAALQDVPYLSVLNVQDKYLDLTNVKRIAATSSELERFRLEENDLLLTEGGDPDKLGRAALWRNEISECIHQNHIFRVRVKSTTEVDPIYLNWHISSEYGRRYFLRSAKQTTGIASINKTQLRQFPTAVPPIELQREFSSEVNSISTIASKYRNSAHELDDLFASLQQRAFRGEL